jgi:hypothetical protein
MNYDLQFNDDGTITVTYDIDGLPQTMTAPTDTVENLQTFLQDYGVAYAQGLQITQPPVIPDDVLALANQSVAVELPAELQAQVTNIRNNIAKPISIKPVME